MKHFATLLLLLGPLAGGAQTLITDGAAVTVQAGALLYVAGSTQQTAGSMLLNAGMLQLTGA
jgi:hypothetical protein